MRTVTESWPAMNTRSGMCVRRSLSKTPLSLKYSSISVRPASVILIIVPVLVSFAQCLNSWRATLRAIQTERTRIAQSLSHVLFSAGYRILNRLILLHKRHPGDRACGRVVFPKSDDASLVEYDMAGQVAKFAYRLESFFHEGLLTQILRV